MTRGGTRWYPVRCAFCSQGSGYAVEHGFTAGALLVLVGKMQDGEVTTVKGNSICLLGPLLDHVPHSTDPRFAFTERVS